MQQIERYGVIALVFLLVTIVAISFWGDSKSPGFWSRITGKNQPKPAEVAKLEPPALPGPVADPNLPLSPGTPTTPAHSTASLGGAQPLTPLEAPAMGNSTIQAPEPEPARLVPPQPAPERPVVLAKPESRPAPVVGEYQVQRGDTLARIARERLGAESRWTEIASLNPGLDPQALAVGQKLRLPGGTAAPVAKPAAAKTQPTLVAQTSAAPKAAPKAAPTAAKGRTCTVQRGDTLRSIARRELGDERRWTEIASLNPGLDPHKLAIGMRVQVPAKSGELLAVASPTASDKPRVR